MANWAAATIEVSDVKMLLTFSCLNYISHYSNRRTLVSMRPCSGIPPVFAHSQTVLTRLTSMFLSQEDLEL